MGLFVVSYDLVKGRDYSRIIKELERVGGHRPTESLWLTNLSSDDTSAVRDHFASFVDDDDRLIVIPFSRKPHFVKAFTGTNDWISANVGSG